MELAPLHKNNMIQTLFTSSNKPTEKERNAIVDFLHIHLEKFRDTKEEINRSLTYVLQETPSAGGFILQLKENTTLVCVVVVAKTGMSGFVPENLLVYIATHNQYRGKGIGKQMIQTAIETAQGSLALHVEPDNPAKALYESLGFTNKYLEMRYIK